MTDVTEPDYDDAEYEPAWWSPSSLLSPQAAALAGFTFAVLSMFGGGIANVVTQALLGFTFNTTDVRLHVVVPGLVLLFFALLAIALASRAIREGWEQAPTWAGQLARAAVVVAVVGVLLSLVTVIGGWVTGGGSSSGLIPG